MAKISEFMHKEHIVLFNLLNKVKKSMNKSEMSLDFFKTFKEKHDQHLYAEEKAIFIFYKDKKNFKLLNEIMDQHTSMRELMNNIEKNLKLNASINADFSKLNRIMIKHVKIEDSDFYPKMDKELNEQEKIHILEKFDQIRG